MEVRERTLLDHFNLVALATTDCALSRGDIAVLVAILRHADRHGYCYPGVTRLTTLSKMSRRNVLRSIHKLEQMHWLLIERTRGSSNSYVIDFTRLSSAAPVTSAVPVTTPNQVVTPAAPSSDAAARTGDAAVAEVVTPAAPELAYRTCLETASKNAPCARAEPTGIDPGRVQEREAKRAIEFAEHDAHIGKISPEERDRIVAENKKRLHANINVITKQLKAGAKT